MPAAVDHNRTLAYYLDKGGKFMAIEQVLVVKAELLNLPAKEYICNEQEIEAFLGAAANYTFLDRPQAEKDACYKQLIPYVTIICRGDVLALERTTAQSEARLHGKLSLGVGGHINPADEGRDLAETISQAMARELQEELWLKPAAAPLLAGLINDDTNSVGSVHLGIHCILQVQYRPRVRETDKMKALWVKPSQLEALRPRLETWSQILLPALAKAVHFQETTAPIADNTART